jgi:hypothetical protein
VTPSSVMRLLPWEASDRPRGSSATMASRVIRTAQYALPTTVFLKAYCMTELAPIVTLLTPDDHAQGDLLRSAGRAAPHTEIWYQGRGRRCAAIRMCGRGRGPWKQRHERILGAPYRNIGRRRRELDAHRRRGMDQRRRCIHSSSTGCNDASGAWIFVVPHSASRDTAVQIVGSSARGLARIGAAAAQRLAEIGRTESRSWRHGPDGRAFRSLGWW